MDKNHSIIRRLINTMQELRTYLTQKNIKFSYLTKISNGINWQALMSVCSHKLLNKKLNSNSHNELSKSRSHYDWLQEDTNANTNLIEKLHDRCPKKRGTSLQRLECSCTIYCKTLIQRIRVKYEIDFTETVWRVMLNYAGAIGSRSVLLFVWITILWRAYCLMVMVSCEQCYIYVF